MLILNNFTLISILLSQLVYITSYFVDAQKCSAHGRTQRPGSRCWGDFNVMCLPGWCFLSLPGRLLLVAQMPVLSLVEGCIGNLTQESRVGVASVWSRLGKHSIDRFGGGREFSENTGCLLIKGVLSRSALCKARASVVFLTPYTYRVSLWWTHSR